MRTFNRSNDIIKTAGMYTPPAKQRVDWSSLMDNIGQGINDYQDNVKKQALVNALQSGNTDEINAAYSAYDPTGAMANKLKMDQLNQQREWSLSDAERNHQWDLEAQDRQLANSLRLANYKQGLKDSSSSKENLDPAVLAAAQAGINQLADVGNRGNIGNLTRARMAMNLSTSEQEQDLGKMTSAIAAIAPTAIQRLKNAGVSGVNTLGEFMTYVGLPEKPTSEQIKGAIPLIAQVAGLQNPYSAAANNAAMKQDLFGQDDKSAQVKYKNKYGLE